MRQQLAWDLGPTETAEQKADRETRITDFLLFAGLPLAAVAVPGTGAPVNELAAIAIVALSLVRSPNTQRRVPPWLILGLAGILTMLVLSSLFHDLTPVRRVAHVAAYAGLVWALATGRVSLLSAARGLALSLAVCVLHGIATLGASAYEGRLTGVLNDPNAAAFMLVTLGAVSVPHLRSPQLRLALVAILVLGVVLTFSRTGLLAVVFGALWILVGRRLRILGAGLAVAGLVYVVSSLPDDLRLFGPFAARTGSDELRERIADLEADKLAHAPWYGNGPGTATVDVDGDTFFFHNSYLAVLNEGGWPTLFLVVALLAGAFLLLSRAARDGDRQAIWAQVGIIGVLVCAVNLGEVLLDLPTAVVLGFAVSTALRKVHPPSSAAGGESGGSGEGEESDDASARPREAS